MNIDDFNHIKRILTDRKESGLPSFGNGGNHELTGQGRSSTRSSASVFSQLAIKLQGLFYSPTLALAVSVGLSLWFYWQVFVKPIQLQDYFALARMDAFFLLRGGYAGIWWWIIGFLGLAVVYGLAWKASLSTRSKAAWAIVLIGSLVMGYFMLHMAPFDSSDIYDNIMHGRIVGVYGKNPFVQVGSQFPHDPFLRFMGWKTSPSAYGPLWEMLAGVTAKVANSGFIENVIVTNVMAFKFLSGIFLFASAVVAALILRKVAPKYALAGTLLLAWNPIAIYETWGNGHNDMAMLFWVLLAILAIVYSRYTLAILALIVGALIKYLPVLMIPAAGMIALYHIKDWRSRIRFILITAVVGLALIALSYAPFWEGKQILTITRRMHLLSDTFAATIYWMIRPKLGANLAASRISLIAFYLTVAYSLVQIVRVRDGKPWERFAQSAFNVLAFYLLFTNLWYQQWYVLWLLALAPFVKGKARRLALVFVFFSLSKQFFIGPHLFWYPPILKEPKLEYYFTLGSYGLPFLYALWILLGQGWQFSKSVAENSQNILDRVEYGLEKVVLAGAGAVVGSVDWVTDRLEDGRKERLER